MVGTTIFILFYFNMKYKYTRVQFTLVYTCIHLSKQLSFSFRQNNGQDSEKAQPANSPIISLLPSKFNAHFQNIPSKTISFLELRKYYICFNETMLIKSLHASEVGCQFCSLMINLLKEFSFGRTRFKSAYTSLY